LSSLSFSFLIGAALCAWDAHKQYSVTHAMSGHIAGDIALALLLIGLAMVGTALRHRKRD